MGAQPRNESGVEVRLEDLSRRYGQVVALNELNLTLAPGELVALLGPSGCGKTTALRLVAGLEEANGGRVVFGGKDVTGLPASKRDVGMVFQAYSLFPHMTAMQNVAFGLRLRRKTSEERRRRSGEMLELVGLSGFADRYAHQLSGGQQQRVALARALAIQPTVLLLDEPLSALDAKVRARLRDEIRRVQLEIGITTLFVTHDQEEALAIADRVGVMNAGHLEQLGPPTLVYSRPATAFVAEFVGLTNRLPGTVSDGAVEVRGARLPLVQAGCGRWSGDSTRAARGGVPRRGRRRRAGRPRRHCDRGRFPGGDEPRYRRPRGPDRACTDGHLAGGRASRRHQGQADPATRSGAHRERREPAGRLKARPAVLTTQRRLGAGRAIRAGSRAAFTRSRRARGRSAPHPVRSSSAKARRGR